MIIYADDNMPLAREFFSAFGEVRLFNGRQVQASQLSDADVLLVRSVTPVNASLLALNQRLKFVGTATIGTDHLDQTYLQSRQIPYTNAPGCNAQSVVEYVLSCLFLHAEQQQCLLSALKVGVVGCGQIGRRLVSSLQTLGVTVLQCDPLRAEQESGFVHVALDDLLTQVDVLSLHVPLVRSGEHATYHLLGEARLRQLPEHVALINACRGEVIDNQALLKSALGGCRRPLFLDVWEHEPDIETALLPFCQIATAHIAGHSVEGKARGTEMLYQALCTILQRQPVLQMNDFLSPSAISHLQLSSKATPTELPSICRLLYDVRRDDLLLRAQLASKGFDWLRKHYPARREFSALTVNGPDVTLLARLGFTTARNQADC